MAEDGYSITVEPIPPEDGGGYLAFVPDLPGCMSDGETEAEAIENAHDAISAWIAHANADGRPVPSPKRQYRDA